MNAKQTEPSKPRCVRGLSARAAYVGTGVGLGEGLWPVEDAGQVHLFPKGS